MKFLLPLVCLSLVSCVTMREYERPEVSTPAVYYQDGKAKQRARLTSAWWKSFGDASLTRLVSSITEQNLDLRAAAARLSIAEANRRIAYSALLPTLDGDASVTRSRSSEQVGIPVSEVGGVYGTIYQSGLSSAWQIDLFGRNRSQLKAADASLKAAVWDYEDLRISLQAELGQSYVRYQLITEQRALIERNIALRERSAKLARDRRANGAATALEVARTQNATDSLNAQIPALIAASEAEITAMAALTNRSSASVKQLVGVGGDIPSVTKLVGSGIPSDLLRTRPDVRAAERRLGEASARRNAAVADLYPSFSLIGSLGVESISAGDLLKLSASKFAFGPTVSLPIFNASRLRSEVTAREAGVEVELANYAQAINKAIKEVERSTIAFRQSLIEIERRRTALGSATRAAELAEIQYKAGALVLDALLSTQESLNSAELELAAARAKAATQLIQLSRALGGGWSTQ